MTTWRHFVGGHYTPGKFIQEARRLGVTRRVAANVARAMAFGDVVQLLHWQRGRPVLFAEFTITDIILPVEISVEVRKKHHRLKISGGGDGQRIVRECGSYEMVGACAIEPGDNLTLQQIATESIEIAERLKLSSWFMVGGPLTKVYEPPVEVSPPPRFSRGFTRLNPSQAAAIATAPAWPHQSPTPPTLTAVDGYARRRRKTRLDLQLQFPI